MSTGFEPDEWLQVWTLTPEQALKFFNLSVDEYEVVVLKDGPQTERERERFRPEAKLFGTRAAPALTDAHSTSDARKE